MQDSQGMACYELLVGCYCVARGQISQRSSLEMYMVTKCLCCQEYLLTCKETYLKVLRAELPVKDVCIADHVILAGGFGDDTGAVLQSPLDTDLQHDHYSNI